MFPVLVRHERVAGGAVLLADVALKARRDDVLGLDMPGEGGAVLGGVITVRAPVLPVLKPNHLTSDRSLQPILD